MPDPPTSPISQLLHTLGITREDLENRSNQMRQFLTAENAKSSRVTENKNPSHKPSVTSLSKPAISTNRLTRTRSRASSFRDVTPPTTPIKTEVTESSAALRNFDSMEMVIERQRRQSRKEKKGRREKERENQAKTIIPRPPSPPFDAASHSDPSHGNLVEEREGAFESGVRKGPAPLQGGRGESAPPVTPQRSKYYREHTELSSQVHSASRKTPLKAESPTPNARSTAMPQPQLQYFAYPQYLAYAHFLQPFPNAQAGPSTLPSTPRSNRISAIQWNSMNSPLPPSSPPPASSPVSTPHRLHVNLVSSPGPMGPLPDEDEYDKLPFTLPPGPYSLNKPDASYAALIGQAILSSPHRRLTLQEIYDWITIVYPYFKRGEQTWMNSIRHVLSTTVCFRKVTRDRALGRTQWAIWDEDLECFKGGGFRKQLCKDFMNGTVAKDKQTSKGKGKGRKRGDLDDGDEDRKAKRSKKDHAGPLPALGVSSSSSYTPATLLAHPLFRPTRPTPQHQPYYESCLQLQPLAGDIIFPPIPADVGYTRVPITSGLPSDASASDHRLTSTPLQLPLALPPPSSSSSVPELTPNSSSSPSSPPPATSEIDGDPSSPTSTKAATENAPLVASNTSERALETANPLSVGDVEEESDIGPLEYTSLVPVKDGGLSPHVHTLQSLDEEEANYEKEERKTKSKLPGSKKDPESRKFDIPPLPISPTLKRKISRPSQPLISANKNQDHCLSPTPSTPPQSLRQVPTSSIRTPLSSKGINPAALHLEGDEHESDSGDHNLNKTPRKRIPSSGVAVPAPVTPRTLVFSMNQNGSPFRTPVGGGFGTSPFRTPGSRGIFDPHDPGALLDEELNRMCATGQGDSPAGLFGKGRGSLLYDSPGLSISPGRWW